ncbi:MAG: Xaa-Pro peptidase family protein [Methanomicrobiales archaeon]|nr:Xaa-Pro peptidase family protein [Methanomicrobiales archaeon]
MKQNGLASTLIAHNCQAYVIYDTTANPDMRYLTSFSTRDPVLYIHYADNRRELIVPEMEVTRAKHETDLTVISRNELGYREIFEELRDSHKTIAHIIQERCPGNIMIPKTMPAALAFSLCDNQKQKVVIDFEKYVEWMRDIKSEKEWRHIAASAQATETAMAHALSLIHNAIVKEEILYHAETKEPLSSELLRYEIHKVLLKKGYHAEDTIVACGLNTAMPHWTGTGVLSAHQPIIIDIFPSSDITGYYADMTRTVSKGAPAQKIIDMHTAVLNALHIAQNMVKPGMSTREMHQAVLDYFADHGFETAGLSGFIHSLGHGVGLSVHEFPSLSLLDMPLQKNQVIAIEPALYYADVGGVRIENIGIVTDRGFTSFTTYPEVLIV